MASGWWLIAKLLAACFWLLAINLRQMHGYVGLKLSIE
jgi:hypothetical protein